jgi:hypothetical protein
VTLKEGYRLEIVWSAGSDISKFVLNLLKYLKISIEIYSRKLIAPLPYIKATIFSLVLPKF